MNDSISDADGIDSTTEELILSCIYFINGLEVKHMLRFIVNKQAFEQYNQMLGRGVR